MEYSAALNTQTKEIVEQVNKEYDDFKAEITENTMSISRGSRTIHKFMLGGYWKGGQLRKVQHAERYQQDLSRHAQEEYVDKWSSWSH